MSGGKPHLLPLSEWKTTCLGVPRSPDDRWAAVGLWAWDHLAMAQLKSTWQLWASQPGVWNGLSTCLPQRPPSKQGKWQEETHWRGKTGLDRCCQTSTFIFTYSGPVCTGWAVRLELAFLSWEILTERLWFAFPTYIIRRGMWNAYHGALSKHH